MSCRLRYPRGAHQLWLALLVSVLGGLQAGTASAVVCRSADVLCTGDPCTIRRTFLHTPCEVDFGNRKVIITGTLTTQGGGKISLSARSIEVRGPIIARKRQAAVSVGGRIELHATEDIDVRWRLDASGKLGAGSILLDAGGDVRILARLRAIASGTSTLSNGGAIDIRAGGRIFTESRARIRAIGGLHTTGGRISLDGARGVSVNGRLDVRGGNGGLVELASDTGDVITGHKIDAKGRDGTGGVVLLQSNGGNIFTAKRIDANGKHAGGIVGMVGKTVHTADVVRARGLSRNSTGGTVALLAQDTVTVADTVLSDGENGGWIALQSDGSIRARARLMASGQKGEGGYIALTSGGNTNLSSTLSTGGGSTGGLIGIRAGNLAVGKRADILAHGSTGGGIHVTAGRATVAQGAVVRADGGGEIHIRATGDLALHGDFRVRRGGSIEASTDSGDIAAGGDFEAGCIGIAAGGSVDLDAASFDGELSMSCE